MSRGNKGQCSVKISQVVENFEGLLMHTPLGKDLPNKFLHIKYCRGLWGNHIKVFHVIYPGIVMKILVSNIRGPSPLNFIAKKL